MIKLDYPHVLLAIAVLVAAIVGMRLDVIPSAVGVGIVAAVVGVLVPTSYRSDQG